MSVKIRQLVNPSDEEMAKAVNVLHEAFNKQYFLGALGGNTALVEPFILATLKAGIIGGEVHVAELPEIGTIGVALWFNPGQKFLSTPEQRNAGWDDIINKLDEKHQKWWDYFLKLCDDLPTKYYGPGKQLQSYHLQLFGVQPEQQRKGFGSALLQFVEGKAIQEGRNIVLETVGDGAVKVYQSLGFATFGPAKVISVSGVEVNGWLFEKMFEK